jgi:hypothetical protein
MENDLDIDENETNPDLGSLVIIYSFVCNVSVGRMYHGMIVSRGGWTDGNMSSRMGRSSYRDGT